MSEFQREKLLIPGGIIWELNTVATQPAGTPSPMGFDVSIPEGERGLFLGGNIGNDNYGAGRLIQASIQLKATSKQMYLIAQDTVDNQQVTYPASYVSIDSTANTVGVVAIPYMPFILTESVKISIRGSSLINAETVTSVIWVATRVLPPTLAAVGTSVTLTTNTVLQV